MRLTERIHLVASGRHGFGLTHPSDCHVYVIDGGSEVALIDAGAGVETATLLRRLADVPVKRDRLRRLFVTHAHADHAGGSAALHDMLGVEVMASPEVAAILRVGDEAAASVNVGKAQGTYPPDYRYRATPVDGELRDGDRIEVGDLVVEAVATPGHSAGHLCYLVHDASRTDLFTGDALLFGGQIILQDTWDCDLRAQIQSLRRLADHRHDGLFPGHLMFSVSDGQRHLRAALDAVERGSIPPTFR